jgi:polysaccharide chain length determinant protein (PEP-CTERM system associated)
MIMLGPRSLLEILHLLLAAAWRRRYVICTPIFLLPPLGLAVGSLAPKSYEARMTFLVQEPAKLNPFLEDLAVATQLKDRMAALNSLAHSQHVLGSVARDLDLVKDETPPDERDRIVKRLSSALMVLLVGSDLIELRIRGERPAGLDRVLAAIGARFIDKLLAPERSSISQSVDFLNLQLKEQNAELTAAEQQLSDFKAHNADKLPAVHGSNISRLSQMKQQIEERRTELAGIDAAFEDLRTNLAGTNPVIGHLEESIVSVMGQLAILRARYTDEHSEVQGALRKLRRLEEERVKMMEVAQNVSSSDLDRLWNLAASSTTLNGNGSGAPALLVSQLERLQEAKAKRASLQQEVEKLKHSIEDLTAIVTAQGPVEEQLQRLERNIAAKRDFHDNLVKRAEMAQITGALGRYEAPERIKIIDAPAEPTAPINPPTLLFVIGGLVGGIALGAGLAAIAEVTDSTVRRREVLEKLTALKVLARIPPLNDLTAALPPAQTDRPPAAIAYHLRS